MTQLTKDQTIFDLIEKLKQQTAFDKAEIVDHWEGLLCSIGIKRGIRMVYIDSLDFSDGRIDVIIMILRYWTSNRPVAYM